MEAICQICDGRDFKAFARKDDVQYLECAACGSLRHYPYPNEQQIDQFYARYPTTKSESSVYLTDTGYDGYQRDKAFTFADLRIDPAEFRQKTLLDVGCATGQFIRFMSEPRFDLKSARGIDISASCVELARQRQLNCSVEDFLRVEERVDVISMWHLVEHLPHPKPFFEHAFKLLQPGGLFLVETPIVGIVARSFASAWRFLMPVEHLNLFSQNALFTLATKCGFNIRSFVSFGSGNTGNTVPEANKRAMDAMVKQLGCGDVLAVLFTKPPIAAQSRG